MAEKRKYKRLPIKLTLEVSSLFNQKETLDIGNAELHVYDISKAGIGFTSNAEIPLGYYFNATIRFTGKEDKLKYVVKIVRANPLEDNTYSYGCEFVGLASIYDYIFEQYEEEIEHHHE